MGGTKFFGIGIAWAACVLALLLVVETFFTSVAWAGDKKQENLFQNPSFELGEANWFLWVEAGVATFEVVEDKNAPDGKKVAEINIVNPADQRVEFDQFNLTIEKGKTYTCSFLMRSEKSRNIISYINHREPPWTVYGGKIWFEIDNEWKEYYYTFTMGSDTDPNSGLVLQLTARWEKCPLCSINGYVWVDNVKLYVGKYISLRQAVKPQGKLATSWGTIKGSL